METRSKEIFDLLQKAKGFTDDKKSKEAIPVLESALALAETPKIKILILETLTGCANDMGDDKNAIKYLETLCELDLTFHNAALLINLYMTRSEQGKALEFSKKLNALEIKNDDDRERLMYLLFDAGAVEEALAEYDTWVEKHPDDTTVKINVFKQSVINCPGRDYQRFQNIAQKLYDMASELIAQDKAKEMYKQLGDFYSRLYDPETAMAYYKKQKAYCKEEENQSGYYDVLSAMYMNSHYSGLLSDEEYIETMRYICNAMKPAKENTEFSVNTNYLKKIRVGFVSSDFAYHSVGKFISSLFKQNISNSEIEIYCYYTLIVNDDITKSISKAADKFVHAGYYTDDQLGKEMLGDNLDIVIDLNNRSVGSKLSLLSERYAPIQMTWMGFPFTCAVPNIDFAVGDPYLDPPDNSTERFMTEKIARMNPSYMCYAMDLDYNLVHVAGEPPCVKNGYITFGNMSNAQKMSPHTLKLWQSVLEAVPGSKLYLKMPKMEGFPLEMFKKRFANVGIGWERVIISPPSNQIDYFNAYNDIDIMLDTTPFSGCTTLAESFFMGMPTVSLKGAHRESRHFSLLEQVGLGDLAAGNDEDYRNIARDLANNIERIRDIKHNLPARFKTSPLYDAFKFRLSFENMIRQTYVRYCYTHKKPFDAGAYEDGIDILLQDCLRAHDVLRYLMSEQDELALILAIAQEYYEMAALLLSMALNKGILREDAEENVKLSLKVLTLLNGVKDSESAVKLIESHNKLLISLLPGYQY